MNSQGHRLTIRTRSGHRITRHRRCAYSFPLRPIRLGSFTSCAAFCSFPPPKESSEFRRYVPDCVPAFWLRLQSVSERAGLMAGVWRTGNCCLSTVRVRWRFANSHSELSTASRHCTAYSPGLNACATLRIAVKMRLLPLVYQNTLRTSQSSSRLSAPKKGLRSSAPLLQSGERARLPVAPHHSFAVGSYSR